MTFHFNACRSTACAFATATAFAVAGCTGDQVKPSYSRSSLEPVVATLTSESTLRIQFQNPLESLYYAAGVSYHVEDGAMKVVVDRCHIHRRCSTMLSRKIVPGHPNPAVQEIPLLAPRVVMVFVNGEQQIYP